MRESVLLLIAVLYSGQVLAQSNAAVPEVTLSPRAAGAIVATGPGTVNEVIFAGCLPATAFAKIAVKPGKRIRLISGVQSSCDSRGWTNGPGLGFYTPKGSESYPDGLLAGQNIPLGMLIGAFSHRKIDVNMSWELQLQIFNQKSIMIGGSETGEFIVTSPIQGYLYLIMNDGNGYHDNIGSVSVTFAMEN